MTGNCPESQGSNLKQKGQKLRLETPGGGGYGNPEMRPEAAILKDRELGYITDQKQEF